MLKDYGLFITFNGKRQSYSRSISGLSWNQQAEIGIHLRHLAEARPVLELLGFTEGETTLTRGQPETQFSAHGINQRFAVYLVGTSHWQVFDGGRQVKGTRYTDNLKSTLLKVIHFDADKVLG